MGYLDRQLDQAQQMLAAGNVHAAHQLVRGIALDEPQNERAQALLAEATQRLQNQPPPMYVQSQPQGPPRPVYYAPPPPAAKRRSPLGFILITVVILGGLAAFLLNAAGSSPRSTPGRSTFGGSPASVTVTMKVVTEEKNAHVNLTYTNATGGIEQKLAPTPWSQTITVKPGTFVSVSAQATRTLTVTCTITGSGGAVIQTATSGGSFVIASCSGSAR